MRSIIRYSLVEPCVHALRLFQQTWRWFEPDSQPDDAVHREPVSTQNSLLTGKNTGKFLKLRPSQRPHCLVVSVFRGVARQRLLESRTYNLNNLVGTGQDVEPRRKIFQTLRGVRA